MFEERSAAQAQAPAQIPPPAADSSSAPSSAPSTPRVELPKGGGIRGLDEKFAAVAATGAGTFSVPIAASAGRSGFGPQLALQYDSNSGNGPFGLGWSLNLPTVTRKTSKGMPQYHDDAGDGDVFILSGVEDLVPVGAPQHLNGYLVQRYRPRIEGLFARIELWRRIDDPGDLHWRSVSRENVLTVYGGDAGSRIADPRDPARIFSWLASETRDDKGNALLYDYKAEDGAGAQLDAAHQRNRGDAASVLRTANRYLKRIRYGNRTPLLDAAGFRPHWLGTAELATADWMFELVFDYGEHDPAVPTPAEAGAWGHRVDAFSLYRGGFEVRTARRCERVLMFHHFPDEPGVGADCLVRSTDFTYSDQAAAPLASTPSYTRLRQISQSGYRREAGAYLRQSLPPVECSYNEPQVDPTVRQLTTSALENLPTGLDAGAQWVDLHGEGIPGLLSEQAGAWFYKANRSALDGGKVRFAPLVEVSSLPNVAGTARRAQFMDLAGDGQLDVVMLDGPLAGFYEHDEDESWQPFQPFSERLNRNTEDPNLRLLDLDGDGLADALISEDDALVWHPSLAERGFGPARRVATAFDEELGPRVVFANDAESIFLADFSGDGLTDIVRIRNGEICYWPNLGYGRFGAKVRMDNAPQFDHPDHFAPKRIRLADIDGSGSTDIIYLHGAGVRLYFNQSGNSWSAPQRLPHQPYQHDLATTQAVDLLGNGTACLVWSSRLPEDGGRQMRYIDLMGGRKPHLLVSIENNLGAETRIEYASSSSFYLRDKLAGQPWITRLPFPVQVVTRVESLDRISRNRFVTRYAYHHGHFDGVEREFRGFGMVEQWDSEDISSFDAATGAANEAAASNLPPILTRTWFHTGLEAGRAHVTDYFAAAGNHARPGCYHADPQYVADDAHAGRLPDSALPEGLGVDERREACRALKGSVLRTEIYALDNSPRAGHPYLVTEQNFTVQRLQPRAGRRYAVFLVSRRESLTSHSERDPADPRVGHAQTLQVDAFGNVLRAVTIAYGRRRPDPALPLPQDQLRQTTTLITYTETSYTCAIDAAQHYRAPLPAQARTFELTGFTPARPGARFTLDSWTRDDFACLRTAGRLAFEASADPGQMQMRLTQQRRTLYRPDDMGAAQGDILALLPPGVLEPLALPGESYKLAFTPGLLAQVMVRDGQPLLPAPAEILALDAQTPEAPAGGYRDLDGDGHWWAPAGRVFLSPAADDDAAAELAWARRHFFLPHRTRDAFYTPATGNESLLCYDAYDLLPVESRDALNNRLSTGERLADGTFAISGAGAGAGIDYRLLKPWRLMDANRNRSLVAFDILGQVIATAVMGKPEEQLGDSLDGLPMTVSDAALAAHYADPLASADELLAGATTRIVYDPFAFLRSKHSAQAQPALVHTFSREIHLSEARRSRLQHSLSYSDGLGREIQTKVRAEPGTLTAGGPSQSARWITRGWTVFNNKGKPVQQFEPFFSAVPQFEADARAGVSTLRFYDPVGRVVATLNPDHSYAKVIITPWDQATWDPNDTVLDDPRSDPDLRYLSTEYFAGLPPDWLSWHAQRAGGELGPHETQAARKAAAHAGTPKLTHFDALGRAFLTIDHNRTSCADHPGDGSDQRLASRVELDIDGRQRAARDALGDAAHPAGRLVMRFHHDLLGNTIHQLSMDGGARWMLNDVAGNPLRAWDSRGHALRSEYDALRRPLRSWVSNGSEAAPTLSAAFIYGEQHAEAEARNLRGQAHLQLDQAGASTLEACDFKGNRLRASRRLARNYQQLIDWNDCAPATELSAIEARIAVQLEDETYTSHTGYDALNRPVTQVTPHRAAMSANLIRSQFNASGLLQRVDVRLSTTPGQSAAAWTPFIEDIDYDAKGQRRRIDYGNGVSTSFDYDPLTFRLRRQRSRRASAGARGRRKTRLQDLSYTYDPIGNITHLRDRAQQAIFFRNRCVLADADYTYDALYRLIEAGGREHLGRASPDRPAARQVLPTDGQAMARYVERYVYDEVGNFIAMTHRGSDPGHPGWSRRYTYDQASAIDPAQRSNRLGSTSNSAGDGDRDAMRQPYAHDAHGNMTAMPTLGHAASGARLDWDHQDRLHQVALGGGGNAWYAYDVDGARIRKVWHKSSGTREERFYLDGFEIFRRRRGSALFERETLRLMDGAQAIALVETRTADSQGKERTPARRIRYQLSVNANSIALEVDEAAELISLEEYSPYGATTCQAVRADTPAAKRYRYAGRERDEESGLSHHGARYYAAWLGRWTAADPLGLVDGAYAYVYAKSNPLAFTDSNGASCDPTSQSCLDPTTPTPQEEAAQACLPAQNSPPMAAGDSGGSSSSSSSSSSGGSGPINLGGAGLGVSATAPPGFTLRVPDSYDGIKLEAYQEGVWNGEIGRNAGRGNSTSARRTSSEQVEAREMFRELFAQPTDTAPGGRGWAQDHVIELQHDLTGRRGTSPFDYRWQDSALNSREGSQSWALQRNNPLLEPAGGVSRVSTSGRYYNTEGYRSTVRGAGTVLFVLGALQTADHVTGAIAADIDQGTGGTQTARAVATETGGWVAASYGAEAGAYCGLACGEFAPICSPVGALVLGGVGYHYGSESVDEAIDVIPTKQDVERFSGWLDWNISNLYGAGQYR
jgi:RHS repeat-associated protein